MDLDFFRKQNLQWLKQYLKERGISIDGRNKAGLVDLAYKAHNLGLEKGSVDDTDQDAITRRTINGKVLANVSLSFTVKVM